MAALFLCLVLLVFETVDLAAGDFCYERYYSLHSGYTSRTIHCSFGCCGPSFDEYCCVSNAGIIVGIVFGVIFVLAILTAAICCCIKKKGSRGRVVRPSDNTTDNATVHNNVFIVPSAPGPPPYSNTSYSGMYASYPPAPYTSSNNGYAMGHVAPLPPAYNQAYMPPPAYSYQDAAYPPPPMTTGPMPTGGHQGQTATSSTAMK